MCRNYLKPAFPPNNFLSFFKIYQHFNRRLSMRSVQISNKNDEGIYNIMYNIYVIYIYLVIHMYYLCTIYYNDHHIVSYYLYHIYTYIHIYIILYTQKYIHTTVAQRFTPYHSQCYILSVYILRIYNFLIFYRSFSFFSRDKNNGKNTINAWEHILK
jgi:hypothetical protein